MYDITLSTLNTQARYDIHCRNEDDLSKKHCRYSEYTDKKKTLTMGQKDNTNNSEYTDKMNEDDLC